MKKNYQKKAIYLFILIFLIVIGINVMRFYHLQNNNPLAKEKISLVDTKFMYNMYGSQNPDIKDRPYYGEQDSPIKLVAYLKLDSEASRYFVKEILPNLTQDYINKGELKYYYKNYITMDDITQKSDNFRYATALLCIKKLKQEVYYDFYSDILSASGIEQLPKLLEKYGIPVKEYNLCISEGNFDELYQDALEVENFGMVGLNQRFYIGIEGMDATVLDGVPSYQKFQRTIRAYEIQLGN
jgi:hypothetical protein